MQDTKIEIVYHLEERTNGITNHLRSNRKFGHTKHKIAQKGAD